MLTVAGKYSIMKGKRALEVSMKVSLMKQQYDKENGGVD